jgi:hypothetical protein
MLNVVFESQGRIRIGVVMADALSVLLAIRRGPSAKNSAIGLWTVIGFLLERLEKLIFVYLPAHCGFPPHDEVDDTAKKEASEGPDVEISAWDEARFHKQEAISQCEARDGKSGSFRARITRGAPWHLPPVKGLTRQEQRLLSQMRTGAVGTLGGWRHEKPEACRWCKSPDALCRDGGAVEHMFACTAAPWPARRHSLELQGLRSLVHNPKAAIRYAKEFIETEVEQEM